MDCNSFRRDHPKYFLTRHACYYTISCLRAFPIMAANVILVLMVRIMVQNRLYYTLLRRGHLVHFACAPVMYTFWPFACSLSALVGVLHFALKAYFRPASQGESSQIIEMVRKFGLPGVIFLGLLARYADIEETLVPLNRISERDVVSAAHGTWLSSITKMSE